MRWSTWCGRAGAGLLVLAAAAGAVADDRALLLQTEEEYVSELLALDQPALAQQQLDLLRRHFPQAAETLHFHQGRIALATRDYQTAGHNFERVLKGQPAAARRDDAIRGLVTATAGLGDFARAAALLAGLRPATGTTAGYARALVELAAATQQGTVKLPARERVAAKAEIGKLLGQFAAAWPADPANPWVQYYLAELEYDRLIALLSAQGRLTAEGAPVAIARQDTVAVAQLEAARRRFGALKAAQPEHPAIPLVEPRLKYLNQLADKLTDASAGAP